MKEQDIKLYNIQKKVAADILTNMKDLEKLNNNNINNYRAKILSHKSKIIECEVNIEELKSNIRDQMKENLFLALVIHTHLDSGLELLKLCDMVSSNDIINPESDRKKLNEECHRFVSLFRNYEPEMRRKTMNGS